MKPNPSNGPLWYDVADHYDTTVREPKEGWKQSQYQPGAIINQPGSIRTTPILEPIGRFTPQIESSFVVQLTGASPPQTADITISSWALIQLGQKTELLYELSNRGNAPLRVFVNLPNDGLLSTQIPMIVDPILLEPGGSRKYSGLTEKGVALQRASVIFYDQSGKEIVGIDSAGFYGLAEGKREVEIDKVWQSLRNER
jgi:hypothetical protein